MAKKLKLQVDSAKQFLMDEAQAWCGTEGLIMVSPEHENGVWQHGPIALLPSSFPRENFDAAVQLCKPFNHLVDKLARDSNFLNDALASTIKGDDFTKRLFELYTKWGGSKAVQPLQLGVLRSDYMVDAATRRLLQVELNTIASSFGCLASRATRLHKHLLFSNPVTRSACGALDDRFAETNQLDESILPTNQAASAIPNAMAVAHQEYEKRRMSKELTLIVVFLVQEGERNYVDQRHLEYELVKSFHIPVLRLTLEQVFTRGALGNNSSLVLDDQFEVSLVYFRAGYTPNDYKDDKHWQARELIESSQAIKCPSVGYHLVGAKKVQQKLAEPGVLEKYVENAQELGRLKACFAGLWSLGDDLDAKVKAAAIEHPQNYVIKPQREGGGNNLYGDQVRNALEQMPPHELASHILMERIFPFVEPAYLMRNAKIASGSSSSELGVFSVFMSDGKTVLLDQGAGHLLRAKFEGVDEGGVASGFAALGSPMLVS